MGERRTSCHDPSRASAPAFSSRRVPARARGGVRGESRGDVVRQELDRVWRGTPAGWSTLPRSRSSRRTVRPKWVRTGILHGDIYTCSLGLFGESRYATRQNQTICRSIINVAASLTGALSRRSLPAGRAPRRDDRPGNVQWTSSARASDRVAVVVGVLRGDDGALDEDSLRGRDLSPTSGSCATQRCTVASFTARFPPAESPGDDVLGIPPFAPRSVNPGQAQATSCGFLSQVDCEAVARR